MENLVSHEAMVKEIKNLCWDNRYREGMTVEHLAEEDEDNSIVAEILMVYLKKYKKGC